jgi:hypothetical protein
LTDPTRLRALPSGRPLIAAGVVLLALVLLLTAAPPPHTQLLRAVASATSTSATGRVPFGAGVAFGASSGPRGGSRETATLALERALGRRLALHRIYQTWEPRLTPLVRWDLAGGRLPVLSVARRRGRTTVPWSAIAAGREDAVIRAQARAATVLHAPLLLSFDHEPENDHNGTPAEYRAAWRRYVAVFRAGHATNVRWVWIMMASSFHPYAARVPAAAYYPGDDVIDWIAADGYNWFGCRSHTWRSFHDTFAPFITWATPHRRPLMIAEWGSLEDPHTPGRKAAWIRSAGDAIRSWPVLRAVLYWNSAGRAGRCPFYIDSSRSSLDAMRHLAAQPYFAAAVPGSSRARGGS